jgi:hypothetical protein
VTEPAPQQEDAAPSPPIEGGTPSGPAADPPTGLDRQLTRRLTKWSLGAGLCAFIPLPFLDDWANGRVRSAMNSTLLRDAGIKLTGPQYAHLINGLPDESGCIGLIVRIPLWVVKWLIFYPIKKILRKILIVFTIHDAVNAMSRAFHHGFLLQVALAEGWSPREDDDAGRLHDCIETICKSAESRPIIKLLRIAMRRGHYHFRREGMRLYRRIRRSRELADATDEVEASVKDESSTLDELAANLEETFMTQAGYFDALACELRKRLQEEFRCPSHAD